MNSQIGWLEMSNEQREALEWIANAGERENELLRRNNLVFDKWPVLDGRVSGPIVIDGHSDTDLSKCTPEERWQAVAFTLHTNIWETAMKAKQALDDDGEGSHE